MKAIPRNRSDLFDAIREYNDDFGIPESQAMTIREMQEYLRRLMAEAKKSGSALDNLHEVGYTAER